MTEGDTIVDVAKKALAELRRPSSIRDIYVLILERRLYEFNGEPGARAQDYYSKVHDEG